MRNILSRVFLVVAAGMFFTACEENAIPELTEPVANDATFAKFFFHAEDAPSANFYFDNDKVSAVNSSTSDEEQGSAFRAVYPSNAYALVPSGSFEINVQDLESNEIAFTQETLSAGENYSIYLVGTAENEEIFVMEDDLPADDPVKIYWRFVNTMADMPFDVDVYAVRGAVPETEDSPAQEARAVELGTGVGFKEGGEYHELEPGSYAFKVFESGSEYDPITSTPYLQHTVNLATRGRTYTTQIKGTYTETPGSTKIGFWRDR